MPVDGADVVEVSGFGFFFTGTFSAGSPAAAGTEAVTVASSSSMTSAGSSGSCGGLGLAAAPARSGDAERGRESDDHDTRDDEELTSLHRWFHLPAPAARCQPAFRGEPSHP